MSFYIKTNYRVKVFLRKGEAVVMKKKVVVAVVAGIVIVALLLLWALFAGLGFLWKQAPALTDSGVRLARNAIKKAEGAFTGIREIAQEASPGLSEKVKDIIPFDSAPESDVAGEDVMPVPRYPGMIRASYAMTDQKRTVVFQGKAAYKAVIDFYQKEMTALGFQSTVINASSRQETYEYRKGARKLEFNFERASTIPSEVTALTIREIQ